MYELALTIHSILRLVVLALLLYALFRAIAGWLGRKSWTDADRKAGLFLTIAADVQLLLGLLLYFVWSPFTQQARADMGAAMKDKELRFWAVEHLTIMLLALVAIHLTKVLARKAKTDAAKHRRGAIGYALTLLLIIGGSPWPGGRFDRPFVRL
jgi:hypothetical protein